MQVTYKNGGPEYLANDYFPHFHYQTGAALADENYDLLLEYWGTRGTNLADLETESEAIETLLEDGAAENISHLEL